MVDEKIRGGVWIVDVSHFWLNGKTQLLDGTIKAERLEANVVLELVSINELGDCLTGVFTPVPPGGLPCARSIVGAPGFIFPGFIIRWVH